MNDATAQPRSGRRRLFVVLAGLYVAQAIPSYLFVAAIPPIMREQGVSRTAIGMIGILFIPLILKFLWAPWVDRFRPIAFAHRAGWIFITQSGIIAAILCLLLIDARNVMGIIVIGFTAALLLSTQDIATDGYAAKQLAPEDRAIGNAIQGGAVAFGVIVGGTMGLVLYKYVGWTGMIVTIAAVSVLPLVAVLAMDEGPPASAGRSVRPSIMAFLRRPEARAVLWIALAYRASEGIVKAMEGPYLVDAGIPLDVIGYISGVSAASVGLAGSAIAAWLIRTSGTSVVLGLLGGLRTICFMLFALHAFGAITGVVPLIGAAGFQTLIRYMEIVALYSLFMSVTSSDQPGTDFTILACGQLLIYVAGSMLSGRLADAFGYGPLFAFATALSAAAVVVTLYLIRAMNGLTPKPAGAR